ncbi:MAG: TOBE domain-containing protein, partial [Pseudomonadota bacterium]
RIAVMSAGELQQLGEAREIYEAPRNVFVADFIGDTNLMEVTVDSISDGRAKCHLGGGHRLTCDAVDGIGAGAKVHLSLRPERLYLSVDPVETESLSGTVRETIYIGTDIATIVDLRDGPQFTVRASNSTRGNARLFEPGQQVAVNMERGAGRLLVD